MDLCDIQQRQQELIFRKKMGRFNATQVFSHLIEELGETVSHFLQEEEYKVKGIPAFVNKLIAYEITKEVQLEVEEVFPLKILEVSKVKVLRLPGNASPIPTAVAST